MKTAKPAEQKHSIRKILKYIALFLLLAIVLVVAAIINPAIFGLVLMGGIVKALIGFIHRKRSEKRKLLWLASTPAQRDSMHVSEEEILKWMKEDRANRQKIATSKS